MFMRFQTAVSCMKFQEVQNVQLKHSLNMFQSSIRSAPFFDKKPKANKKLNDDSSCQSWYCNAPLGKNMLGNMMKKTSEKAGCAKLYTNHCLRVTCSTALVESAGFESRDILSVNGHQSEQSRQNYSKKSHERKRQMAASLGSHLGERGEASGSGPAPAPS